MNTQIFTWNCSFVPGNILALSDLQIEANSLNEAYKILLDSLSPFFC